MTLILRELRASTKAGAVQWLATTAELTIGLATTVRAAHQTADATFIAMGNLEEALYYAENHSPAAEALAVLGPAGRDHLREVVTRVTRIGGTGLQFHKARYGPVMSIVITSQAPPCEPACMGARCSTDEAP